MITLVNMKKKKKNEIDSKYSIKCKTERGKLLLDARTKNKKLYDDSKKEKEIYSKFKLFSKFGIGLFVLLTLVLILLIYLNAENSAYYTIPCVLLAILLGVSVSSWYFYGKLAEKSEKICRISKDGLEIAKYATCRISDPNWVYTPPPSDFTSYILSD